MSSTTTSSHSPPSPPVRRPYHGSCHCGRIRYVVLLSLPPAAALGPPVREEGSVRFYKCNCTVCHKMGIFHLRAPDPPHDFYLLSPLHLSSLSDYQCNKMNAHWYFCSHCGVRCFTLVGEGEVVAVDLEAALGTESEGKMTNVWRCKEEGWFGRSYFSINAHTIEAGQEGFDLRVLLDNKWLSYLECKDETGEDRYDYPHEGGTW